MVGLAKGIEREELEVEGCDESSVCEYRQTGHLGKCLELIKWTQNGQSIPTVTPFTQAHTVKGM